MNLLQQQFDNQHFFNEYQLVNGVAMHAENPDSFQIPPDVIKRHDHPASLVPLRGQNIPSRGWGEDFWVRITERCDNYLRGVVDNPLAEARLHGLNQGAEIIFNEDHIPAVHDIHRQELRFFGLIDWTSEYASKIHTRPGDTTASPSGVTLSCRQ